MIRTAFIAFAMVLCTLVLGPPLILFTLVTKSATLMYWTGVKMVVYVTRIAGAMRTRLRLWGPFRGASPYWAGSRCLTFPLLARRFVSQNLFLSIARIATPLSPALSKPWNISRRDSLSWSIPKEPAARTGGFA